MTSDLVSTDWLASHLNDPQIRIVDCRWVFGKPGEGKRHYEEGHIPGAVHLDVDTDLSAKKGPGRHPLPSRYDFQKTMSKVGVGRETHLIVYDEGKGAPAARFWWLLKFYGHEKVSVLDGGWKLWREEGRPVDATVPEFASAEFTARPKRKWVVDKAEVDQLRDDPDVLLIDARVSERYRGESEPIDSRAGHIPGAKNLPYVQILDPESGRFLSHEQLKSVFEKLEVSTAKTVICYCGSGVTACTDIFALRLAGLDSKLDIKLYEGSWGEWSRDTDLPAAT